MHRYPKIEVFKFQRLTDPTREVVGPFKDSKKQVARARGIPRGNDRDPRDPRAGIQTRKLQAA